MITHSFDELLSILKRRKAQIELNRELYTIYDKYDEQNMSGDINVEYDGRHLVTFHYLQTNIRVAGRTTVRGTFTVKFRMYPDWYEECIPQLSRDVVHIDEYFRSCIYNETFRFEECLDKYLPIGNEDDKEIIKNSLTNIGLRDVEVVFDTYQKTYLVKSNLHEFLDFQKNKEEENVRVYKYTSLETYRNILNHGTFRMNSIIAMNDENESLWADLVTSKDDTPNEVYYKSVVKNKNLLITSFTSKEDNATMWRLYGDQGKGICMAFTVPANRITKVLYVNEKDEKVRKLKEARTDLLNKGIKVEFSDMSEMKYYIKHSDFSVEGEYRYLYDAVDENLDIANYGDLLSPYKDFKYDESTQKFGNLPFKFEYVIIGKNIHHYKTDFPLLVAETAKRFPSVAIYESEMIALR